jgi:U3 small nucleolar RNA-associated protein 3
MVRRRKSRSKDLRTGPRPFDKREGEIKRWNTLEDIPMDEGDQCALAFCPHGLPDVKPYLVHASKDRILLEGDETGADDDGDEEEVFALKGIPSSESDEDEEDVYEEGGDDEDQPHPHPPACVRKGREAKAKPPPESDEEEEQASEEEEGWGHKKSAYYSSNAAELDSDDEEANELEGQEAMRIQVMTRDTMLDDDFGLADLDLDDAEETECVLPIP